VDVSVTDFSAPIPHFKTQGTGPTVLMLHGIGGNHLAFEPQLQSLAAAGYRAVSWDMPGYGASTPAAPYDFDALADACIRLIAHLQTGPVVLLGHSMGGMVAQQVVARRADAVRALVLCATSPSFGRKPDGSVSTSWQEQFIGARTAPLDAGQTMAQLAASLVPQMAGPSATPADLQLAMRCMASVNPATYRQALQALLTFDQRHNLPCIAVPTLLVAGAHDKSAPPAVMKAMASAIPASQYAELPGVGHLLNLEAPQAFDTVVLKFLSQINR
jgi:3-oxoadipate enol-lactonase